MVLILVVDAAQPTRCCSRSRLRFRSCIPVVWSGSRPPRRPRRRVPGAAGVERPLAVCCCSRRRVEARGRQRGCRGRCRDRLSDFSWNPGSVACRKLTRTPVASRRREHVIGWAVDGLHRRQPVAADAKHGARARSRLGQNDVLVVVGAQAGDLEFQVALIAPEPGQRLVRYQLPHESRRDHASLVGGVLHRFVTSQPSTQMPFSTERPACTAN